MDLLRGDDVRALCTCSGHPRIWSPLRVSHRTENRSNTNAQIQLWLDFNSVDNVRLGGVCVIFFTLAQQAHFTRQTTMPALQNTVGSLSPYSKGINWISTLSLRTENSTNCYFLRGAGFLLRGLSLFQNLRSQDFWQQEEQ